jgi:response regulator of citrate/malate metabolism
MGAAAYLTKPITVRALLETLDRYLASDVGARAEVAGAIS